MKNPLVDAPSRLNAELRSLIAETVARALETIGDEEYLYVGERIGNKLEALHGSSIHWVRDLWRAAAAMHWLLREHAEGNCELSLRARRLTAVALHYLVNPFDVIPDHLPAEGYLDDALVLNYCAIEIDRESPGLIDRYLRKVARAGYNVPCP